MTRTHSPSSLVAIGAAVLLLGGCGESGEERASGRESPTSAEPLSEPVVEEPVNSIIRPDVAPDPVVVLPPKPLTVTVPFPQGTALGEGAERQLASILDSEAVAEGWPIVLRGHSDSSGGDAVNLRASRRRAEAVAAWLTEHGIAEERRRIIAFGEQNPVAPNAKADGSPDEEGRARNRRVEVIVSPDGRSKEEAAEKTATEGAVGQDTAAEKAIERLTGADTP